MTSNLAGDQRQRPPAVPAPESEPPFVHHRLPSACDLHPNEPVTGFCAACLRERLHGLGTHDVAGDSQYTSALKSVVFKLSGAGVSSSKTVVSLRRCKSFTHAAARAAVEPGRKSCDARTTLLSLFDRDDEKRPVDRVVEVEISTEIEERRHLGAKEAEITGIEDRIDVDYHHSEKPLIKDLKEIDERRDIGAETKVVTDHIDVDVESSSSSQQQGKKPSTKDIREIANSFWLAASLLSKKLQNWGRKRKMKRQRSKAAMPVEKGEKFSRKFRDTQSEIGLDAFGRRSCDIAPRFSLDAGLMSVDDPRFSLDEPRGSCDDYLVGGQSVCPRISTVLSEVENHNAPSVLRSDGLIAVEEDSFTPGGSTQTRDYYLHSSSRRRHSLDRSSSIREQPVECNELRSVSNTKVSPAVGTEFFHSKQAGLLDRELSDWRSKSLRDDFFGNFESVCRGLSKEANKKKSKRWTKARSIWEFLHRRVSNKEANLVDNRSQVCNCKVSQSNNNISFRHSFSANVGYGSMKRSSLNVNGHAMKRRGEFVFDRNRSSRYTPSPSHSDNGMLRFYLTPIRNSWRSGSGSGSAQQISSHYFTKTMLGLY